MEAVGVEESEACEVAGHAELFGGRGQEQEAGDDLAEGFNHGVLGAGGFGSPAEVMGFVDDEEIPSGGDGLFASARCCSEETEAGDDELVVEEGIGLGTAGFDGRAAFLVEDVEQRLKRRSSSTNH